MHIQTSIREVFRELVALCITYYRYEMDLFYDNIRIASFVSVIVCSPFFVFRPFSIWQTFVGIVALKSICHKNQKYFAFCSFLFSIHAIFHFTFLIWDIHWVFFQLFYGFYSLNCSLMSTTKPSYLPSSKSFVCQNTP